MKKIHLIILTAILSLSVLLIGCAGSKAASGNKGTDKKGLVTLKVGAALVPHAEILNHIKPKLKKEGIDLKVVTLDDEAQLNPALQDKQIDANYFQHVPYLDSVSKEKGYKFKVVAKVHVEPIGFYSNKIKSIDQLKDGAKIAITNDPSNEYRMLILLESQNLIKLKDGLTNYQATPKDIVSNPKHLKFVEVDSGLLTRSLQDVDGAVINTNRVLEAKIDPNTALFREDANSPYANVVVVRSGDENRKEIKTLVKYLLSDDVRNFIKNKYGVAVVPAF